MNFFSEERSQKQVLARIGIVALASISLFVVAERLMESEPSVWFKILAVITFVLLCSCWILLSRLQYIGFMPRDPDRLVATATRMLRESSESLYYFGAVGFINTPGVTSWQDELDSKLKDPHFNFVRMIYLQTVKELEITYQGRRDLLLDAAIQYRKWIQVHMKRFKGQSPEVLKANRLYSFLGAPIWQYGLHVIVFDQRDVLVAYRKDNRARGFVIWGQSVIGRDIVSLMEGLISQLHLKVVTYEDMRQIHEELDACIKTLGGTEDDGGWNTHFTPTHK